MKMKALLRSSATFLMIFCLFSTPLMATTATATANNAGDFWKKKGEKNFKQGLKYEAAEQWDKAAEEFALAVAAKPEDAEYRLHYRRALFNASQMMMQRGRTLSEQKDFIGAYNAFRQAYGYDPTNELARQEMERMMRLQNEGENPKDPNKPDKSPTAAPTGVKLVPTAYTNAAAAPAAPALPQEVEQLRDIKFTKVPLKETIQSLAQSLDLNVIFDKETFRQGGQVQDLTIDLKNVTTAQALDYIFLQENLFFQKIGRRAILVASQQRRSQFQQLVLRTFYLANANPETVRNVLSAAIPPQPGRPPSNAIIDKDTNSITVRDTAENIKVISQLVKSLDKDRAEVVMDVNIYEVTKQDLLQIGNQIGSATSLQNLGGSTSGVIGVGGSDRFGQVLNNAGNVIGLLPRSIATGILLPSATLSAFQSKGNAKLLASTQIHAFNNEESQARIGQRVPVQTAQAFPFSQNPGGGGQTGGGVFGGGGFPVINYEQVGLTLKFTPIVFPNQDVQVKMSIESKDVAAGVDPLTPNFSERSISGTARIQNNRTLLLASVAQDSQRNTRAGLPILGLIPILGRLFTAPRKENNQVDIVIAVTPRVLRAPSILPEDEVERETGSIAVPTNSSLSQMLIREDEEDRIAAARRLPTTAVVQLPDQQPTAETPAYVPAKQGENSAATAAPETPAPVVPKPIESSAVKTLNIAPTAEKLNAEPEEPQPRMTSAALPATPSADLRVAPVGMLKAGEKRRVAVMVNSTSALRLAVLSLGYDAAKVKINRVVYGEVFGAELVGKDAPPFAASGGNLMATFPIKQNQLAQGAGVLAYLEIEALTDFDDAAFQINNASSLIGVNGESLIAIK